MLLVLGVVGKGRKSGKTRLIEDLTSLLNGKGYRVASVKHIMKGTFDTPHKDTWRHLQAGAMVVVASTSTELVTIKRLDRPSLNLALNEVPKDVDIVLIEGFRKGDHSKIIVARTVEEAEKLSNEVRNAIAISGLVAEEAQIKSIANIPLLKIEELLSMVEKMVLQEIVSRLPGLDCGQCGYDSCQSLALAIQRGEASLNRCEALLLKEVTLTIDGDDIPLNRFTQKFIKGTVIGMVKSLKGVKKFKKITLEIK